MYLFAISEFVSVLLSCCNRFDAIVSADAFENLKPAPDIFLAASKILDVPTDEVSFYSCHDCQQILVLVHNYLFGHLTLGLYPGIIAV